MTDPSHPEAPPHPEGQPPGSTGPRVTRDEIRDLARLRRSRADRKVAGVAAGLARHLDIDPLVVRVAFVVLVFFGGGGLLLYVACWLLVPDEATDRATVPLDERSRAVALVIAGVVAGLAIVGDTVGGWGFPWPLAVVGVIALVVVAVQGGGRRQHRDPHRPAWQDVPDDVARRAGSYGEQVAQQAREHALRAHAERHGWTYAPYQPPYGGPVSPAKRGPLLFWFALGLALLVLGVVATVDLAGVDVPPAAYPASVLGTCAVMLLVGAFYGRAGGLILVGLVAALATVVTSVSGDGAFTAGQVTASPVSAADVEDRYAIGAGEIVLDLTELPPNELAALGGRTIDLDGRFGRIEVIVPADGIDVAAVGTIDVGGEARVFSEREENTEVHARHDGGTSAPLVTIDAHIDFGEIRIHTEENR